MYSLEDSASRVIKISFHGNVSMCWQLVIGSIIKLCHHFFKGCELWTQLTFSCRSGRKQHWVRYTKCVCGVKSTENILYPKTARDNLRSSYQCVVPFHLPWLWRALKSVLKAALHVDWFWFRQISSTTHTLVCSSRSPSNWPSWKCT